ncbi:MAG TPA: hypothetical protein VHB20_06880 [Verrucomicrobiae bacterium]|nr:hypothetical protein [Verrucomicrobiae bacterium]
MTKRLLRLFLALLVPGCPLASPAEQPARIHYQELDPARADRPWSVEFSVWEGGASNGVDSGKVLFREKAELQPDSTGFAQYWLGNGTRLLGALPEQRLGLEKVLFVQVRDLGNGQPAARRFALGAIDQAYVVQNMRFKSWPAPKRYHPDFKTVLPDQIRRGVAVLYPDGRVQKEDGSFLRFTNSMTSGVQELFDYCASGNVDGYIVGGSVPHSQQVVYQIKAPLHLHPAQGFTLETGSILLAISTNIVNENGLTIDSCMMVNIFIRGLIVYRGNGYAVAVQPHELLPLDTFVGRTVVDTDVEITSLAGGGILFDGSINFSRFAVSEINGGKVGVHVTPGSSFSNNKFTCMHVHGHSQTGLWIEAGARNTWEINYHPDGMDPTPVITAATDDLWFAAIGANTKPGLILRPTASGNQFHLMALGGGFVNQALRPSNRFYVASDQPAGLSKLGFSVEQPAVAASGVSTVNRNPYPVIVTILTPGAATGWALADVYQTPQKIAAPLSAGQSMTLMPGEGLALDYTGPAPTWAWRAVP